MVSGNSVFKVSGLLWSGVQAAEWQAAAINIPTAAL